MKCWKSLWNKKKTYYGEEETYFRYTSEKDVIITVDQNDSKAEGNVKQEGSLEKLKTIKEDKIGVSKNEEPGCFNFYGQTFTYDQNSLYLLSNKNFLRRYIVYLTENKITKVLILLLNIGIVIIIYVKAIKNDILEVSELYEYVIFGMLC